MQAPSQQEPIVFFDLPFTANSNALLHTIYTDPNVNVATRLLLFVSRYSTGYLKLTVPLSEGFILQETGMSRSALYKAKSQLLASGKITIGRTKAGNCVYCLAPHLQSLKEARRQGQPQPPAPSTPGDGDRPQAWTPHVYKEKKENDHHQQPKNTTESAANGDDVFSKSNSLSEPASSELTSGEPHAAPADRGKDSGGAGAADSSQAPKPGLPTLAPSAVKTKNVPDLDLSEAQAALAAQLRHHTVSARQAEQLVRTYPVEVIGKALAGMIGRRDLINPAGWLVREIRDGGYSAPAGVQAENTRAAVAQARAADNQAAEAERQRKEEAARPAFERIDLLPTTERDTLLEQARAMVAKLSPKAAADDHGPAIRAAMVDLLLERERVALRREPISQGFVPHRGGWNDLRRTL